MKLVKFVQKGVGQAKVCKHLSAQVLSQPARDAHKRAAPAAAAACAMWRMRRALPEGSHPQIHKYICLCVSVII